MTDPVQHYSTETSLFSGKTRAYLRYKAIPFESILPSKEVVQSVLKPRVGRRILPVVITSDNQCLQDTSLIIDHFEQQYPEHSVYPVTPLQRLLAMLLEVYGDEWLVMPAMHYRWHFKRDNFWFILNEFGGTRQPNWPRPLQPLAALPGVMFFGVLYKPFFGITRRMHRPIEQSYEAFLQAFNAHLEQQPFLFGSRPSIGDLGLIGPLYAHLYRDPYPGKLMRRLAPNVADWVQRMQRPEPLSGDFLADDAIPETLYPILQRMAREQLPVITEVIQRVDEWARKHPEKTVVPRIIGRQRYSIEGVSNARCVIPFSQWMFQRPWDYYQQLSSTEKDAMAPLLQQLGLYDALNQSIPTRLQYQNYQLQVVR